MYSIQLSHEYISLYFSNFLLLSFVLQNENEADKLTPVTRHWSWRKSSILIVTSLEGDELKLLMRCASLNVRSKSGSKIDA